MQNSLRISTLTFVALIALALTPCSYGWDLCGILGIGGGSGCGSGCDPGCGCDSCCGCEVGCGCEPSCGCGGGCNGCQFGGQTWNCCNSCGPPICPCTDCGSCGCGVDSSTCGCGGCGCEASCGCGCGDCCDVGCGCEPTCGCGCGDPCGCKPGCGGLGFGSCCGQLLGLIDRCCCGCSGCDSEMYWSEWHNDPPCCHDPCDCYGNWTGGGCGGGCCHGNGGYCEPYEHAYCPSCSNNYGANRGYSNGAYYAGRPTPGSAYVARRTAPVARNQMAQNAAAQGGATMPPARVARPRVPAHVVRSAGSTAAPIVRNTPAAPPQRVAGNPNPWRGTQRLMPPQPITNSRPATGGQLTRKPTPPAYNTFQR